MSHDKKLSMILAMDLNRAIGKDGGLPWRYKEDLAYFRKMTLGHVIIMGRKTFESIGSKPLPKRNTYVVSRTETEGRRSDNLYYFSDLGQAIAEARLHDDNPFIVGGGSLYKQCFDKVTDCYLTLVLRETEGDVFLEGFPWDDFEMVGYHGSKRGNPLMYYRLSRKESD
jgi:dihydrofolate reductase